MISLKSPREIERMRRSGRIVMAAIQAAQQKIAPGVTTRALEHAVLQTIRSMGARSSTQGYRGFPASCCVSVNEVVIHGIPDGRRLKEGDIVSVDVSAYKEGYHADAARTFPVGPVSEEALRLIETAREAFFRALKLACPGHRVSDLSHAIQSYVESCGYSVVRDYSGHGVGSAMHEEPDVPNYGEAGHGARLLPGMTLAVEPMVCQFQPDTLVLDDRWSVVPCDGGLTAHYENTVLITDGPPELLTVE